MLSEKNTLWRPRSLWFTGCRARSPGHRPFCARASISVPGAPAPSLATGSQDRALNPGLEIRAPDWVAIALLATRQPCAPRSVTLLAPVGASSPAAERSPAGRSGPASEFQLASVFAWAGERGPVVTGAALPGSGTVLPGLACAPGASHTSEVAARARQAPTAAEGRMVRYTAGTPDCGPQATSRRPHRSSSPSSISS